MYKPPVDYRSAVSRTPIPEAFVVEGGIALLAEAPADPNALLTSMTVTVGGVARIRVTGTPQAGEYRVRTQTIMGADGQPRTEYLPILEFHASDENASGTCDYWRLGTVLTAEFWRLAVLFLTPLIGIGSKAVLDSLYPPSYDSGAEGRPGRVAFLADGSQYFSDGAAWRLTLGATGTVDNGVWVEASVAGVSQDAAWTPPGNWVDTHLAAAIANEVYDAVSNAVGSGEVAAAAANVICDAAVGHAGPFNEIAVASVVQDASYVAPPGPNVLSSVSALNVVAGRSISATLASIPVGSLVVLFGTTPGYIGANGTAASANLTFTHRRRYPDNGGAGTVDVLTAVAGANLTDEAITYTNGDTTDPVDKAVAMAALVISGADASTFYFSNISSAGADVTTMANALAITGTNSLLLAAVKAGPGAAISITVEPGADTSEITEQPGNAGANGYLRSHVWVGRANGPVSTPASPTINGTFSAATGYMGVLMEVLAG